MPLPAADLAQIDAAIGAPEEKPGGERPDGVAHRRESAKREPGRRHVHRSEYVIALGAGGWWTIFAPVLMTYLLVRVSGVALLERGLALRRPGYAEYIRDVPSFIPRPPR